MSIRGIAGASSARWATAATFLVWLVLVVLSASRHELWRDEVHAVSLVEHVKSPADIPARIVGEGHPVGWFVLLEAALAVRGGEMRGLSWLSVGIGALVAAFFLWKSPFGLWFKAIVAFGVLAAYDYTVVFRPYGLTMGLLFVAAWRYPRRRQAPLTFAAALALAANTSLPGLICAGGFLLAWVAESLQREEAAGVPRWRRALAMVVVIGALAGSVWTMLPPHDSVLPVRSMSWFDAAVDSLVHPERTLNLLFPHEDRHYPGLFMERPPLWIMIGVIAGGILGLLRQPALALATAAVLAVFGLMTRQFYELELRHQGFYFVFLVCMYWIYLARASGAPGRRQPGAVLPWIGVGAVTALALSLLQMTPPTMRMDWERPMSANEAFGRFLRDTPQFRDAIVMAEPDSYIESLPYYAPNVIFMPRERRFSKFVSTTSINRPTLTLETLLDDAMAMRRPQQEVLVAIGHKGFDAEPSGQVNWWRDKVFTWTERDLERFRRVAEPIAEYWSSTTDEKFTVFRIR